MWICIGFHYVLFFAGLGAVSVLFGCSKTTRDMKIATEDTIVRCFDFSNLSFQLLFYVVIPRCLLGH